ncbi:unnamed protein product [Mytilus coruscus]|uniref:Chromo domain-containing protein n=1 Tax=Mytilus coruscus TaxID=42192 RepID=A0A6J8C0J3_MYTCO|nr:unnamed protein product [Mytilus coruscus]
MNNIIDNKSGRINIETNNAIQNFKYSLKACEKSAIAYHNKKDYLHEGINTILVKNMKTSCKQYKLELEMKRNALEEKKNRLNVRPKAAMVTKRKAKELCAKAAKKARVDDLGPNHTYGLHHCNTHKGLTSLIHANRLKPYEDPVDRDEFFPTTQDDFNQDDNVNQSQDDNIFMTQNHNSQTQLTQNDDEYGIVQDVLACSRHQGRKVYKIKWENFAKTTWEPAHNVPQFLVQEFHVKKT